MHRLRCLLVAAALAVVVSVAAAVPAGAAKGGNSDNAKLCQKGGWTSLFSETGDTFAHPGDCVNDGAQGHSVFTTAGEAACHKLTGSDFGVGPAPIVWTCLFLISGSQDPSGPAGAALTHACAVDSPTAKLTLTTLSEGEFGLGTCAT
jgi:hypothetical protein